MRCSLQIVSFGVILWGLFSAESGFAEERRPSGEGGAPQAKAARVVDPTVGYRIRVAKLRTQYLQALTRLEEKLTTERQIDAALSVRTEIERFRRGNSAPDLKGPQLAKLRELGRIFSNEVKRMNSGFEAEMAAFRKRYGEEFVARPKASPGGSS